MLAPPTVSSCHVCLPEVGGGRRIQKVFTQNSTTATTNFFCDGNDAVEGNDQNGSLLTQYARTSNVEEPVPRLIFSYVLSAARRPARSRYRFNCEVHPVGLDGGYSRADSQSHRRTGLVEKPKLRSFQSTVGPVQERDIGRVPPQAAPEAALGFVHLVLLTKKANLTKLLPSVAYGSLS